MQYQNQYKKKILTTSQITQKSNQRKQQIVILKIKNLPTHNTYMNNHNFEYNVYKHVYMNY